ncbi:MAG: type II secretion system F family protein, partial [Actinomycetota bacterium]
RGNRRHGLAMSLEVAAINLRPGEFVVLALLSGVVFALLLSTVMNVIGFFIGLVFAPMIARSVVSSKASRRRRAFDEQLPDVLHMMVTLLQSGYGLPQTLDAVSTQAAEPAAAEFRRVLLEVRIGRDPTAALASTAERMRSGDFAWVVSAIHINREVGGELASILESIAETVRERQRLARDVRALTAEGRMSAWILTALPILLVVALGIFSPNYFAPMKQSPGPQLLVLAVFLLAVGWLWMRHLVSSDSRGR